MAERVILVCDVCGNPAQRTVTFSMGTRKLAQDLCANHLQELARRSHAAGRPRSRRAASSSSASTRRRARQSPKASKAASAKKSSRKRITDPAVLANRRAALEKARQALAKKRASAKKAS
jgi:hypothetical protein